MDIQDTEIRQSVERLSRDLAKAAETLSLREVRFLVDSYYSVQGERIRTGNQIAACAKYGEPVFLLDWLHKQSEILESQIHRALNRYSKAQPVGLAMRSVCGVGPVIASGMLAHIDITRAPVAGSIWKFAGLDGTTEWGKGQKRPFNASLKTLCWKLGESFVKVSANPNDFYGQIYLQRKELETGKNEAGDYADDCAAILKKKNFSKSTDAYKAYIVGKLPKGHIHARAKRYAVKLFLSHLHEVWRKHEGLPVPDTYPIAHLGHVHKIDPPFGISQKERLNHKA